METLFIIFIIAVPIIVSLIYLAVKYAPDYSKLTNEQIERLDQRNRENELISIERQKLYELREMRDILTRDRIENYTRNIGFTFPYQKYGKSDFNKK